MAENPRARTRRRRFGLVCIGGAILMLLAGEVVLKPVLSKSPIGFVIYWLTCLVLTALAAGAAIVDAARLREQSREEQRELLEETLREVDREKQARKTPGPKK